MDKGLKLIGKKGLHKVSGYSCVFIFCKENIHAINNVIMYS